ncbi:uncharacterized protein LOC112347814 [Selaginella moellendorffii]|uniref:uncharacterized protein LOC112347814 n=1 Tax=Selaginella moellendorffii TaxID=88036 RepID=UPI000D1CB354|nr:uncharacterized protein LOC112347814 [Selaginella moellendorffii]|eukprot:XP_024535048.1 uncharacterized protein LOC112347814 [Selaginella moellendorffii]
MGAFLWSSSTSKRAAKDRVTLDEEEVEEMERHPSPLPPPPPLVLHSIEAACLEELLFDPEADYAQVLEEARSYAKQAAASNKRAIHEDGKNHQEHHPKSSKQSTSNGKYQRTAKVYFVPPPILDDHSRRQQSPAKKKRTKSWSWIDPLLLLWRSGHKSSRSHHAGAKIQSSSRNHHDKIKISENAPRRKKSSASGPLPLYTDGNRENPRPWHRNWSSSIDSRGQSGPLAAISCSAKQDAASPYVPLHHCTNGPPRKWTSGPLYVTS